MDENRKFQNPYPDFTTVQLQLFMKIRLHSAQNNAINTFYSLIAFKPA